MVRIPTAQTDPNSKGSGGKWIDAEGLYHFAVEAARDMTHLEDGARVEFDLVVLKSDQDGQEEKKMTEKFYVVGADPEKTKACLNRLTRFFCATLIYSEAQWQEDIANGVDRDFDIDEVVGRQFCTQEKVRRGHTRIRRPVDAVAVHPCPCGPAQAHAEKTARGCGG
jgi:hypothetical protein